MLLIVSLLINLVDIDECPSNPCHNAGTCTDKPNGYICGCVSGWTGVHCETSMWLKE